MFILTSSSFIIAFVGEELGLSTPDTIAELQTLVKHFLPSF